MPGLLNLKKPAGVTSRDVVNQIQRLVGRAKIGHAGTLDPLATGVLVVAIGSATRLIEYVQRLRKSYEATFLLGRRSDTDDTDGTVVELNAMRVPTRVEIDLALPGFTGEISQRPPAFSAVKVAGKRAYDLARRGQTVSLSERPVTVHALRIMHYEYPELVLEIECGSGTYVRSLGRDLAESVGTAAVMSELVRTAIGPFGLAEAMDPYSLTPEKLAAALLPMEMAVSTLPQLNVTADEVTAIEHGLAISRPRHGLSGEMAALGPGGELVAVLIPRDTDHLRPEKVLGRVTDTTYGS